MAYDYRGKVVIITGGGRGMGAGVTTAVAKSGASVVITGRTEEPLKALCEALRQSCQADIHYLVADGSDEAKVKEVVAWVAEKYGRIDAVINNAQAEVHGVPLEEQTKETFDLALQTGLYATFGPRRTSSARTSPTATAMSAWTGRGWWGPSFSRQAPRWTPPIR